MSNVLIRDLPADVHRVLAEQAAARGQSLQAFLAAQLTELASLPSVEELFAEVEAREGGRIGFSDAVAALDETRAPR